MSKKKFYKKESLLIGALTSSFGVFISKALGLLYYSPLSALAGEENMVFYSVTYTYYDLLLKISSAGIPFAIAALVAKYVAKDDYKTALLVRKLGMSLVLGLSFISAFLFIVFSKPLARQSMGALASAQDIQYLKNLFMILLVAVILVPFLSTVRSYYQGLKRLDLYASSQVLEQFVRVFTIIIAGFLCVQVLKLEKIWAIYTAIGAAGFAALIAIIFFKITTRKEDEHFYELVSKQEEPSLKSATIFREIVSLGVPYLLISFFGSAGPLINTTYFLSYVTSKGGMPIDSAKLSLGILQANCSKLLAIPQVLTSGFCAGLVPYLTESKEKHDAEKLAKQVIQILDTVLFILIPVLFMFFFFAKDIYFIMYGNANLEVGANLFRISLATGFTETVLPILSSIMITLGLKKESILTLIGSFVIKFATFFVCVKYLWAAGMTLSTCIASIISIAIYLFILSTRFDMSFSKTIKRMLIIIVSSFIMVIPACLIHYFIPFTYNSRLMGVVIMGLLGLLMLTTYFAISVKLHLPQTIFGMRQPSLQGLLNRFRLR